MKGRIDGGVDGKVGQREAGLQSLAGAGADTARQETGPDVIAQPSGAVAQLSGDNLFAGVRIVQQIEISPLTPGESEK